LQHFADPSFLAGEMNKFSALGFPRFCPELVRTKCAYRRQHVYSAYIMNVERLMHEQFVNFRSELFIWEDLDFNIRAHDVCKCFRFTMMKRPFRTGGCTDCIAYTENPLIRCPMPPKLTPDVIIDETLQEVAQGKESAKRHEGEKNGRGPRSSKKHRQRAESVAQIPVDIFTLEDDTSFTVEGAVCDDQGYLSNSYYKGFIQGFKDLEVARNAGSVAAPSATQQIPSGMRPGDERMHGVNTWDDTTHGRISPDARWGAGWTAKHPTPDSGQKTKARWFNIRIWGSWRFAFVMAHLQRQVWIARFPPLEEDKLTSTPAGKKARKVSESPGGSGRKKPRVASAVGKEERPKTTLLTFFRQQIKEEPVDEEPKPPKFADIRTFFKGNIQPTKEPTS